MPQASGTPVVEDGAADLKSRLLRLTLLPFGAAALGGTGVALFLALAPTDRPSWTDPVVIAAAVAFLALIAFLAVGSASKTEAELRRKVSAVRRSTVETHYKVWQVLDDLQRSTPAGQRWSVPLPNPGASAGTVDEALALLAAEARQLRSAAEAVAQRGVPVVPVNPPPPKAIAASTRVESDDAEPAVGIFVNRARRLQVLAHREIIELDFLERQVEDPDLLKGLFSVDHLATRVRRHAENLAVLGGGPSHRQWSRPVNVYEALRSSVAEVEHYARVKLVRPVDGTLKGHAVADFIHLVAELVENATLFSPPNTQVLIRVGQVRTGLAVEVEDRGLGMEQSDRQFYNNLLASPGKVDLEALLADGRIGLYVVAQLARRHKFVVQLQSNIFGGTQAVVVVPAEVLGGGRSANAPAEIAAAPKPRAETPQPELPAVQMSRPRPTAGTGHNGNGTGPIEVARHSGPIAAPPQSTVPERFPALPVTPVPERVPALPEAARGGAPFDSRPALPEAVNGGVQFDSRPALPEAVNGGAQFESRPALPEAVNGGAQFDSRPALPEAANGGAQFESRPALPESPAAHGGAPFDSRPPLPKRSRQQHLAPQLRDPQAQGCAGSDSSHDPGLMKAFQQGRRRADAQDHPIPSSDSSVIQHQDEEA